MGSAKVVFVKKGNDVRHRIQRLGGAYCPLNLEMECSVMVDDDLQFYFPTTG